MDAAAAAPSVDGAPVLGPEVRRLLMADAVLSRGMDSLTGGAILAGLGLWAGADNFTLALLAALPFLAQVAQLPAIALLLRWTDRRRIVVACAGAARLLLVAIAALLFAAPSWLTAGRLVGILAVAALLAVVATAAWNWWMRDLVPAGQLGALFGRRMQGSTVVALAVLVGSGVLLDAFTRAGGEARGYGVLFAAGATLGLTGVVVLARTPHVAPPPSAPARGSLALIPQALRSTPPAILWGLSLSTVAASLALPFSAVFLLRGLGYSYSATLGLAALSLVAYLLGLRGWGHVSDRHGDRPLLAFTIGILGATLVGWALAGWPSGWTLATWLAALHFLAGYALGGIELANTNILLRAPGDGHVAARLAGLSLVRAACGGVAVLSAGAVWQALGPGVVWSVSLGGTPWTLRGFQVLCLLGAAACLACLAAVHRMPRLNDRGLTQVARTLRREVHQMSSVAGMRGLIHAVSYSVEFLAKPFAVRSRRGPRVKPRSPHDDSR